MGLKVNVIKGEFMTATWEILESELGENLAGSESSREEIWGSTIMKSLGLHLLPQIADKYKFFYVSGTQLNELEQELKTVREKAGDISSHVRIDEYSLLVITRNILKAVDRAKQIDGGILIW
jgi:hypothetical protein